MSSNEPRDDEILGRALSRAIETVEVNETPYEGSRIAMPPVKRGLPLWRLTALAAVVAMAVTLASVALPATGPVADQPTPTAAVIHTPAATVVATPTPATTPAPPTIDRDRIYFARRDLPPVGVHIGEMPSGDASKRITRRMAALLIEDTVTPPPGVFTARPARGTVTAIVDVRIANDTVTIDLGVPTGTGDWNVRDVDAVPLRQQIVYTATEEAGIRYVIVTQNGGQPARIGSFSLGTPLSREEVSGYTRVSPAFVSEGSEVTCAPGPCPSPATARLSSSYSVDVIGRGVVRFEVRIDSGQTSGSVDINVRSNDETRAPWTGKYTLEVDVRGTEAKQGLEIVDRSPLRSIKSGANGGTATYELGLDDLRPWRVVISSDRVIVDIGGTQALISGTVAVYAPSRGDTVDRQFTVTGLSRTFEATTAWRVRDLSQRVVAQGATTASRGTSNIWGTYQFVAQLPSTVTGPVTLEVYWASPRDGTDMDVVQVPLTVR